MAAPAKSFNIVADANLAAGQPGLSSDWVKINDNTQHLEEWMGKNYVAAIDHDHDGVNSKSAVLATGSVGQTQIATDGVGQAEIVAGAVHTGELSTSTSISSFASPVAGSTTISLTNEYMFMPLFKNSHGTAANYIQDISVYSLADATAYMNLTTSYVRKFKLGVNGGTVLYTYLKYRYVSASPPHRFAGSADWGMFVNAIREISTGRIVALNVCPDPVWDGDLIWLPKNHPGRIAMIPHPFDDFVIMDEAGIPTAKLGTDSFKAKYEIVLLDLRSMQDEVVELPHAALLDQLKQNGPELKQLLGLSDAEIAEGEADQLKLKQIEAARASIGADLYIQAAEDFQEILKDPTAALLDVSKIKARLEQAKRMTGRKSKWQQKEEAAKRAGKTMAQIINAGELPEALATKELPLLERAKLPQVPAFKDVVRVLQA